MIIKSTHIASFILGITLFITVSCKVGQPYTRPDLKLPDLPDQTAVDTFSMADLQWWDIYGDTLLQKLIRHTLEYNKDMLTAGARIKELAALKRVDISKLAPQINGRLYGEKDAENYGGNHYSSDPELSAKILASWELDIWGNLRWGAERSKALLMQSIEEQRALQVSLVAQVAQSYFELVALDQELSIVKQTLHARQEGVRLAKIRFEGGLTSETSYQQAQVELARTATLVPELEKAVATKENEIALLTGDFPHHILRLKANDNPGLLIQELPAGLSSSLLERRPDIRAAEKALQAAHAEVGIALTNMFPKISLTAQFGVESDEFSNLLKSPAHFLSASLLTPLFAMGKNRAQLKAQKAAREQSVYQYEKQVITAFKEVSDAIITFNKSKEVLDLSKNLEQAAKSNNKLADLQYINGYINYLDVLDAQRGYFDAQIGLNKAMLNQRLALVKLYKSLGGGWN